MPGIGEGPLFQIIDTIGMPEGWAEAKKAIVAEAKTIASCTAMEEVVALGMGKLRNNEFVTPFFQGLEPLGIRLLQDYDLSRGESFRLYFLIP